MTSLHEDLSPKQKNVAEHQGDVIVTACPGAGKTRTVAARAARLSQSNKRVALTSYTNVGADEIVRTARLEFGEEFGNQHFSGTLHGFLSRYVLRPFGYTEMHCARTPVVQDGHAGTIFQFAGEEYDSNDFRVGVDEIVTPRLSWEGERYSRGQAAFLEDIRPSLLAAKRVQARKGVVSLDDAIMWSAKTLLNNTVCARSVAVRFDEIIVDEAQDTSDWQMICLKVLKEAGLSSLFLVGDFNQSIYSFAGTSPDYVREVASELLLDRVPLDENWRSSQAICNVASTLKAGPADVAVGANSEVDIQPSVITYPIGNSSEAVKTFAFEATGYGIDLGRSGVLARKNETLGRATGASTSIPRSLGGARYFLELALHREQPFSVPVLTAAERYLEGLILSQTGSAGADLVVDPQEMRALVLQVVAKLPGSGANLSQWTDEFVRVLRDTVARLGAEGVPEMREIYIPARARNVNVEEYSRAPLTGESLEHSSTIHGAKGKSLDGVLLIASEGDERTEGEASSWSHFFAGRADLAPDEECRVLYVAVTRAQRFLQIAVPENTDSGTYDRLAAAGFEVR